MSQQQEDSHTASIDPKTSVQLQKCHPYTENLNSELSRDSDNAFLHQGDVSGLCRGRPGARRVVQQVGLH